MQASSTLILLITATLFSAPAHAATVTITPDSTFQTIEGFGAQGAGNFGSSTFRTFITDDFGVSVLRFDIPFDFEPTNDNSDPLVTDLSKYNTSGRMGSVISTINAMKSYPGMRFIASCWSPPGWMKDMSRDAYSGSCSNGTNICGGHLAASKYQEFAEFMVAYYRTVEQHCGVKLYAMSIQNEPFFAVFYKSCVYTPTEYRDVLKIVRARFAQEGIDVRLFGAEDMAIAVSAPNRGYFGAINVDAEAKAALSAVAVHGYSDGISPQPTSTAVSVWNQIGRIGKGMGKPVWMTETSGYEETWDEAMRLAVTMHVALVHGNLSLWTWWTLDEGEVNSFSILNGGRHTKRSYAAKHYYRYVRPGAVRLGATCNDTSVAVSAFAHSTDRTMSLVLVNWTGSARTVGLVGPSIPSSFAAYRSSATENCAAVGSVGASVSLPAMSITTLYGQNYLTSVELSRARAPAGATARSAAAGSARYTLRGERIDRARGTAANLAVEVCPDVGARRLIVAPASSR